MTKHSTPVYKNDSLTVHRIDVGSNAYVIENDAGLFLIDAGYPGKHKRILKAISQLTPKELKLIFITHGHFDHYGSAAAIREATSAPIAIHALDSLAMANGETPLPYTKNGGIFGKMILPLANKVYKTPKIKADILLRDRDSLQQYGLRAAVVHTPGHTRGSSCLLVDEHLLFSGDLVLLFFKAKKQNFYANDWSAIDSSIKKIQAIAPAVTFTGHGNRLVDRQALLNIK